MIRHVDGTEAIPNCSPGGGLWLGTDGALVTSWHPFKRYKPDSFECRLASTCRARISAALWDPRSRRQYNMDVLEAAFAALDELEAP